MKGKLKSKLWELQTRIKGQTEKCHKCGRDYYLTIDHIVPRNILFQLNLIDEIENWEENFDIICGACNHLKSGILDLSDKRTIPLLEEAIKKAKLQIK